MLANQLCLCPAANARLSVHRCRKYGCERCGRPLHTRPCWAALPSGKDGWDPDLVQSLAESIWSTIRNMPAALCIIRCGCGSKATRISLASQASANCRNTSTMSDQFCFQSSPPGNSTLHSCDVAFPSSTGISMSKGFGGSAMILSVPSCSAASKTRLNCSTASALCLGSTLPMPTGIQNTLARTRPKSAIRLRKCLFVAGRVVVL